MGREISDSDLLGGSDDGWDVHGGEEGGQEFSVADPNDEDDINAGLDDPLPGEVRKDDDADLLAEDEPDAGSEDPEGEPAQEPEGESEELTPWEKKNYSQAMQKRITRERKLKRAAEERYEEETVGRQDAEQRAYEAQKLSLNLLAKDIERDIKDKTAELKRAKESGETDDEIKASAELDDLRAKKRKIEEAESGMKEPPKVERKTVQPATNRWMERNQWFTSPEFSAEAQYARAIDVTLSQEGKFKVGTPEYFAELDRRIHANIPVLRSKIKKAFGAKPPQRVAPVNRSMPGRHGGGNTSSRVVLSREEVRFAHDLGLTSKAELEEYAKNKMKREREELAAKQGRR